MIHQAGTMDDSGVQRCARCGTILVDYRQVPGAGTGWNLDASIEVKTLEQSTAGFTRVTQEPPDCVEVDWQAVEAAPPT